MEPALAVPHARLPCPASCTGPCAAQAKETALDGCGRRIQQLQQEAAAKEAAAQDCARRAAALQAALQAANAKAAAREPAGTAPPPAAGRPACAGAMADLLSWDDGEDMAGPAGGVGQAGEAGWASGPCRAALGEAQGSGRLDGEAGQRQVDGVAVLDGGGMEGSAEEGGAQRGSERRGGAPPDELAAALVGLARELAPIVDALRRADTGAALARAEAAVAAGARACARACA